VNTSFIFDLDGTLVDTAPDLLGALNAVLLREGRHAVDIADLRHLVGHGARAMLVEAMKMTGAPADLPGLADRLPGLMDAFIAHYRAHIADESRIFPDVETTLAQLAADGARLGVLSNKPQELCDRLLAELDLARYFTAIHGAGRYAYTKPDARVFHHVVEELGGADSRSIMIGDSATDVATARAAGAPVIVLTYGYTPEPAHLLGADAVTDHFADVPMLAKKLLR
jgi:phosphoglycolate phosphatase